MKLNTTREQRERLLYKMTGYDHWFEEDLGKVFSDFSTLEDELARVRESLKESKLIAARWQTAYDKEVSGSIDDRNALDSLRAELAIVSVQHQQSLKTRDELCAELEAARLVMHGLSLHGFSNSVRYALWEYKERFGGRDDK